jgi:hypothetical protein
MGWGKRTAVAAWALVFLGAGPAPAQQGMGMMGPHAMMGMGPGMAGGSPLARSVMPGPGMMGQHLEGQIAFLRAELKVTPEQEKLFGALEQALRANAKAMTETHAQMMQSGLPGVWPERLAWQEQMLAFHLEALRRLKAAAEPLYAALSEAQRQVADGLMLGTDLM